MAGWITELLGSLSGDVAEVVQGTPALAARHQEIVAKRVAREIEAEVAARAAGAPRLLRPLAGAFARRGLTGAQRNRRRAGAAGEDAVCAALRSALGRRWTIVRGAVLQTGGPARRSKHAAAGVAACRRSRICSEPLGLQRALPLATGSRAGTSFPSVLWPPPSMGGQVRVEPRGRGDPRAPQLPGL